MSAEVTLDNPSRSRIWVARANAYDIDKDTGYLHLSTNSWGNRLAVFKSWLHVVIEPDRGPDGKFVKKG